MNRNARVFLITVGAFLAVYGLMTIINKPPEPELVPCLLTWDGQPEAIEYVVRGETGYNPVKQWEKHVNTERVELRLPSGSRTSARAYSVYNRPGGGTYELAVEQIEIYVPYGGTNVHATNISYRRK